MDKDKDKELEAKKGDGSGSSLRKPLVWLSLDSAGETQIVERVIQGGGGSMHPPMLTRTNYQEWSLVMKVQMEAKGLWDVISDLTGTNRDDRHALAFILKGVPAELMRVLAVKATTQDAWEAIKVMRVGTDRVCKVKASTLHSEYDNLRSYGIDGG
uniref:Uncharacterized protein n=1 Tax=Avena sativa TaxID=4498 RepID=A0ACD5TW66_AVESA